MTAALAAASARYGVSVAERLATDGRGGSITMFPNLRRAREARADSRRRFFFRLFGAASRATHPRCRGGRATGSKRPPALWRRRLLFYGMTAAMAAATSELGGRLRNRAIADRLRPAPPMDKEHDPASRKIQRENMAATYFKAGEIIFRKGDPALLMD